jgi:periplasmic protein CpxP/Spy
MVDRSRSSEMAKTMVTVATKSAWRVRIVMFGMLVSLLAVLSLSASAQPAPPQPGMMDGGRMGHMHHGGDMGGGMMFGGSAERMGRMIDHMLDGLNANDAQRSQIKQIAASAGADLKTQAQAGRALRLRAMQAFTAPTVDAAAVEQVRAQMVQQHDQMSRRMTQAMLDIARVLTPEQRAKIGERMRDRQARMEERMQREQREPPRR